MVSVRPTHHSLRSDPKGLYGVHLTERADPLPPKTYALVIPTIVAWSESRAGVICGLSLLLDLVFLRPVPWELRFFALLKLKQIFFPSFLAFFCLVA